MYRVCIDASGTIGETTSFHYEWLWLWEQLTGVTLLAFESYKGTISQAVHTLSVVIVALYFVLSGSIFLLLLVCKHSQKIC